ncbi:Protein of unknown function [Gryllus bimaculatus]|nr:Protein of unknown function [Gryllus bimaculatus]
MGLDAELQRGGRQRPRVAAAAGVVATMARPPGGEGQAWGREPGPEAGERVKRIAGRCTRLSGAAYSDKALRRKRDGAAEAGPDEPRQQPLMETDVRDCGRNNETRQRTAPARRSGKALEDRVAVVFRTPQ